MEGWRLEALRRLLFYSRQEAGMWVASTPERPNGVSERAWRQWETGAAPVPADVSASICGLVKWRQEIITSGFATSTWVDTADQWAEKHTLPLRYWRPYQSAIAAIQAARLSG
ncbi:DUF1870 family protein [Niveispirillum fermenti]|uniref:Aca2/YdiL-like domain-containing protein n=1 Tax=Niveispirillum fermenti TaxID=1233113 RepID=UPI003A84B13B